MEILFILILIAFFFFGFLLIKSIKKESNVLIVIVENVFWLAYAIAFLFFASSTFGSDYHQSIDPVESNYTAFSNDHIVTLAIYLFLFLFSSALLRIKGKTLPPLVFVFCMIFMIIGIIISIAVIQQVSGEQMNIPPHEYTDTRSFEDAILISLYPAMNILIAILILTKINLQEAEIATTRQYKNKILNFLNQLLGYGNKQIIWVFLLLFPVFAIITLILMLFGQEPLSILKAFTETTTWRFSQHTHPPYLDHSGHYLCTVAACGHPQIVKPVRLGKRHGHEIIVNRQLMIANAYEEMIQNISPKVHKLLRYTYDKYGFPLSKYITTPFRSNITYLLMKPLEWFFLINLYSFYINPETQINKQYAEITIK